MLNIHNQVYITVKLDGAEPEFVNIRELTLAEGNGAYAPTAKIELDDPNSVLSKSRALVEGNKLEILISRSDKSVGVARKYRVFGPTRDNPTLNPKVTIVAILDSPQYFTASVRESITGTTDEVLSTVAGKCGLKYVGPDSGRKCDDRQKWPNVCSTRARYIHDVIRHAYMDKRSCMSAVVTSLHELRYKNLTDSINVDPKKVKFEFSHNANSNKADGRKVYAVKETHDKSNSGVLANWVNYGSKRVYNDIEGKPKDIDKCEVKIPGLYVAVNKDISDDVKKSRIEYASLDSTNTHPKYEESVFQNLKILSVFSEVLAVLVDVVTDVQLYDPVVYRQADADIKVKVRNEDLYLVVGKTIVVRGGIHYAERIQLARMSVTMKGTSTVKSCIDEGASESFNSILGGGDINFNAIGSSIGNLSTVLPIAGLLQNVGSQNANLGSSLTSMYPTLSSNSSLLNMLMNAIRSGNTPQIESLLPTLAMGTQQLTPMLTNTTTASYGASTAVSNLSNAIYNPVPSAAPYYMQPAAARATMSAPNGPVDAIVKMVTAVSQADAVTYRTTQAVAALPPQYKTTPTVVAMTTANAQNRSEVEKQAAATAVAWNATAMALKSQNKPLPIPGTTNIPTQGIVSNNFSSRLAVYKNQIRFSKNYDEKLRGFLQGELDMSVAGNPNWQNNHSLIPSNSPAGNILRILDNI